MGWSRPPVVQRSAVGRWGWEGLSLCWRWSDGGPYAVQRSAQQGPWCVSGALGGQAALQRSSVGVLQRQTAQERLQEREAELARGQVIQQRVQHRAQVEEAVGHRMELDVAAQVTRRPCRLGHGRGHQPADMIGHPAHEQSADDQHWENTITCERRKLHTEHLHYIWSRLQTILKMYDVFFIAVLFVWSSVWQIGQKWTCISCESCKYCMLWLSFTLQ